MKTKKLVLTYIFLFLAFFKVYSVTNYDYVSQMNSEIDPKVICFPSAMLNCAIYMGLDIPEIESEYTELVDKYDEFLHSEDINYWVSRYSPQYIRTMITSPKYNNDIREMWQIEECAFNSLMGYRACKLKINKKFYELQQAMDSGSVVVISGLFCGRKHCVSLIKLTDDIVTFIDSFGDPYDQYKDNSSYKIIDMDRNEFLSKVIQDDGRYTFIEFNESFPKSFIPEKENVVFSDLNTSELLNSKIVSMDIDTDMSRYQAYIKRAFYENSDIVLSYDSFVNTYNYLKENYNFCINEALTPLMMTAYVDVSLEYLTVLFIISKEFNININNSKKIENSFYSAYGNIENALRIFVDGYHRYLFLDDSELSNEIVRFSRSLYMEDLKDDNIKYVYLNTIYNPILIALDVNNFDLKYIFYTSVDMISPNEKKKLLEERTTSSGRKYYITEIGKFVICF